MKKPRWLALCAISLLAPSCANSPIAVSGIYDHVKLGEVELQANGEADRDLHGAEIDHSGVEFALADPNGFYRIGFQLLIDQVTVTMPEGPADFSGVGAGLAISGRRILGIVDEDSVLLTPYRFEFHLNDSFGGSQPTPGLYYDRFHHNDALFDLGIGAEFSPLIITAGWAVQFVTGRIDATDERGDIKSPVTTTFDGTNHGPYAALGFLFADEQPIRMEVRIGGGDLEQLRLMLGVGF